jgi:single-strand DNA-binding protein
MTEKVYMKADMSQATKQNPPKGNNVPQSNFMSRGVNLSTVLGWCGSDPIVRSVKDVKIANFSLATNESWVDKEGNKKEHVEWHNIVTFGRVAELAEANIKKGSEVYVQGKKVTSKWTDRTGKDRLSVELHAHLLHICSKLAKKDGEKEDLPF